MSDNYFILSKSNPLLSENKITPAKNISEKRGGPKRDNIIHIERDTISASPRERRRNRTNGQDQAYLVTFESIVSISGIL